MRKYLALLVGVLLVVSCGLFQARVMAQAQEATPEAAVKTFYTWFIKRDAEDHGYPLMDKEIYRYVAKGTVDVLRSDYKKNKFAERAEYFTDVQDYDEKDWLAHIAVRSAIMLDDVAVVPVTFGSADKKTVIAFLRKVDGGWKITKVDDTRDYD